jgi:hypothetical protein
VDAKNQITDQRRADGRTEPDTDKRPSLPQRPAPEKKTQKMDDTSYPTRTKPNRPNAKPSKQTTQPQREREREKQHDETRRSETRRDNPRRVARQIGWGLAVCDLGLDYLVACKKVLWRPEPA